MGAYYTRVNTVVGSGYYDNINSNTFGLHFP